MTQTTDSITLLLHLLSPGKTPDARIMLLSNLGEGDWAGLVQEAQRQNVEGLIYLTLNPLTENIEIPSAQLGQLHNAYLSNAGRNTLNLHSAGLVLAALKQASIEVIGLKGIYLLENLYGDIGARPMSDVDILVHQSDLGSAVSILQDLGYTATSYFDLFNPNLDIKHIPPMFKPNFPPVEVHWTLLEEHEPFSIDPKDLWQRARPARIAEVDVLALGVEDLIAHLSLHLTYQHYLKLGLRGLYDIALLIHRHKDEIDWPKLAQIARSWQAEKVIALTLALASDLLGVEVPQIVTEGLLEEPIAPEVLAQARMQLLGRDRYQDYLTPDLVDLARRKSVFGKIKLGLSRVFLPRLTLARLYGVPPNSPRILGCYFKRFGYLLRQYGKTLRRIEAGDFTLEPALEHGKISEDLHAWMSHGA